MQKIRGMEIKVGALVLVGMTLIIGFMIILGDFHCRETKQLWVDFPSSGDLKTGAPVKITGVTVGKVAKIELWGGKTDPEHGNKKVMVRVKLELSSNAFPILRKGSRFYITTLGALGEKYVEIDPGPQDAEALSSGDVVDGVEPMRLELLSTDASTMLASLSSILRENKDDIVLIIKKTKNMIERIDQILEKKQGAIEETVERLQSSVRDLEQCIRMIRNAIGDGKILENVITFSASIAKKVDKDIGQIMETTPSLLKNLEESVKDLKKMVSDLDMLIMENKGDIRVLTANLKSISQLIKDGRGSIGAFLSDREIYDDFIELIKDLKQHPWKMLMKQ